MAYIWTSGIPTTRPSGVCAPPPRARGMDWKGSPKFRWGSLEESYEGNRVHGGSFLFAQAGAEQDGGVEEGEGSRDDERLCREGAYHVEE